MSRAPAFDPPQPAKPETFSLEPLPGHQPFKPVGLYHDSLTENLNVPLEASARELEERRERLKAG
jgi:hypothetical protein